MQASMSRTCSAMWVRRGRMDGNLWRTKAGISLLFIPALGSCGNLPRILILEGPDVHPEPLQGMRSGPPEYGTGAVPGQPAPVRPPSVPLGRAVPRRTLRPTFRRTEMIGTV